MLFSSDLQSATNTSAATTVPQRIHLAFNAQRAIYVLTSADPQSSLTGQGKEVTQLNTGALTRERLAETLVKVPGSPVTFWPEGPRSTPASAAKCESEST
jgi:hypothetical protein